MPRQLAPIDDNFFDTAGLVVGATIDLPHSPEQVWTALGSDAMGSWMSVLDQATWHSPRPLTVGARRSVRLLRLITLHEEYYRWDETQRRSTFRVTDINFPIVTGWAEDMHAAPLPDGGTRLSWTMAIDNKLLRLVRIPRRLQPAVTAACRKLMEGITTILPDPPARP